MNNQKGAIGLVVAIIVGFIGLSVLGAVVSAGLGLITIPWLKFTSQIQTNRDIVEKTYNADNALVQYHWFQERAEAIKATEKKTKIAKQSILDFEANAGARVTWTFEDKNEHARLTAVFQGLKNHYEDIVAEYNARAKETDRAIFKDELPLFFSLESF